MSKAIVPGGRNNVLIVSVTIVVLSILLMVFWDRQQQRAIELRRIETRLDLMQEWEVTRQQLQNKQMNNGKVSPRAGRVL